MYKVLYEKSLTALSNFTSMYSWKFSSDILNEQLLSINKQEVLYTEL